MLICVWHSIYHFFFFFRKSTGNCLNNQIIVYCLPTDGRSLNRSGPRGGMRKKSWDVTERYGAGGPILEPSCPPPLDTARADRFLFIIQTSIVSTGTFHPKNVFIQFMPGSLCPQTSAFVLFTLCKRARDVTELSPRKSLKRSDCGALKKTTIKVYIFCWKNVCEYNLTANVLSLIFHTEAQRTNPICISEERK